MQTTTEKHPTDKGRAAAPQTLQELQRQLMAVFWAVPVQAVLIALILRAVGFPSVCPFFTDAVVEYAADMLAVCLTVCLVPLALRLFRFHRVRRQLPDRYAHWVWLRLVMLQTVLMVDAIGYGLFGQASYFYLALMVLLAMAFVYPSRRRCEAETTPSETE